MTILIATTSGKSPSPFQTDRAERQRGNRIDPYARTRAGRAEIALEFLEASAPAEEGYDSVRFEVLRPVNSFGALQLAEIHEVDSNVLTSSARTAVFVSPDIPAGINIADAVVKYVDGEPKIIDVIGGDRRIAPWLIERMKRSAARRGYIYEAIPIELVCSTTERSNAELIQAGRHQHIDDDDVLVITEMLWTTRSVPFGRLAFALSSRKTRSANILFAMIVKGLLSVDMTLPLGPGSLVSLAPARSVRRRDAA
ncbi:MAG: hypothetical protein ACRYG4_15295 [Janthinobacterium lividum]